MAAQSLTEEGKFVIRTWLGFIRGHRADAVCLSAVTIFIFGSVPAFEFYMQSPDHGFQLMLGSQILQGKIPSIDLVAATGPLVGLSSAAGLWFNYSLLPETMVCALMYIASVYLIYRLVNGALAECPSYRIPAAFFAVSVSLLFLPRFYKWYYWFFPMAIAALVSRAFLYEERPDKRQRVTALAALLTGVAALYRPELGVASLAAMLALVILFTVDERDAGAGFRLAGITTLFFLIPVGAWTLVLEWLGGSIGDFMQTYLDGARSIVDTMSLGLPEVSWREPLSNAVGHRLAFVLVFITYTAVLAYAFGCALSRRTRISKATVILVVLAMVGLSILPQALHRKDVGHFLQVAAPFFALNIACWFLLWARGGNAAGPSRSRRVIAGTYIGLSVWMYIGLSDHLKRDYETFGQRIIERYELLAGGPEHYVEAMVNPERRSEKRALRAARAALAVRQICPAEGHILVLGTVPVAYWFDRRIAGLFPYYYEGIYEQPRWINRDFAAIEEHAPSLVLIDRENPIPRYEEYINVNYTELRSDDLHDLPYRFLVPRTQQPLVGN